MIKRAVLPTFVLILVALLLAPLVVVAAVGLTSGPTTAFPTPGLSTRWIVEMLSEDRFIDALRNSFVVGILATAGGVIVGVPAALALSRFQFKGRAGLESLVLSPLMFPSIVLGLGLLQYSVKVGIAASLWTVAAGHLLLTIPYFVRLVTAALMDSSVVVERAARTLGATPWQAFRLVTFPQIRGAMAGATVFAFIMSFEDVSISIFLSPLTERTFPVELLVQMDQNPDPVGAGASVFLMGISLVLIIVLDRTVGVRNVFLSRKEVK